MADGLKLALFGLHRGGSAEPDTLVRRARLAEEVGFESFWIGDHIALPSAEVQGGDPPAQPRLEAVVALAYMAALTHRVRLAIGVIVLPQRQPVLLAKQLSTIDVLSKGRLIVGIGVGYLEPELLALGASLAERGARTDEYLAAMRALWDQPTPSFAGRFVAFADVIERPRPVQRPHPPIVIGGHSPAAPGIVDPIDTGPALPHDRRARVVALGSIPAPLGGILCALSPAPSCWPQVWPSC